MKFFLDYQVVSLFLCSLISVMEIAEHLTHICLRIMRLSDLKSCLSVMDCITNRESFVMHAQSMWKWTDTLVDLIIKSGNFSSELPGNFSEKDLGKPILDTVLDPGDLLYFPRGTIHQVNSFSCYSMYKEKEIFKAIYYTYIILK